MEGEHAQMWQMPCKMTNSSSKPLQTPGNQEIKKKNKTDHKNPEYISHLTTSKLTSVKKALNLQHQNVHEWKNAKLTTSKFNINQ